jgi:hypothetical protein
MEFSMAAVANRTAEKQDANNFPTIRFFSVGEKPFFRMAVFISNDRFTKTGSGQM